MKERYTDTLNKGGKGKGGIMSRLKLIARPASRNGNDEEDVFSELQMWTASQNYFEQAQDPELVEFAIYDMEAAKRRYMFLLKRSPRRR